MMKRQIIGIFFLLLGFVCPETAADIPVFTRIRLKSESSGRDAEFIRNTARQIDRLRRVAGKKLPDGTLLVAANSRNFFYDGRVLKIPGDARKWETDHRLKLKITGALAAARFGINVSDNATEIAPWICAGIADAVKVSATRGKYIAGNRTYPLLAAWVRVNGSMPNAAALCRMPFPGEAVTGEFAAEHARMLLEIFARNGRIMDLFADSLAGAKPDSWLKWYSSAAVAEKEIASEAEKLLWNPYSPLPVKVAKRAIAELQIFHIPEYKASGQPTGNIVSGDIKLLASQLAIPRQDTLTLRKDCAAPWRMLAEQLSPEEEILCHNIAELILAPEESSALPENFNRAVGKLLAALETRSRRELFFRDALDHTAPPVLRLKLPLSSCSYRSALPEKQRERFFLQTLDRYIR